MAFACSAPASCPAGEVIAGARAVDSTHVEVALLCPLEGVSLATVRVDDWTRGERLAVHRVSGGLRLSVETDPQRALASYTVRLDGVRRPDGLLIDTSANFVGVGELETAPVTLRLDDRYSAGLVSVNAVVTFDPETGVFTHYSLTVPLADPDGDHVWTADVRVAVDPLRTVATDDDRLGGVRQAYAARAVAPDGAPLSPLVTFEVRQASAVTVDLPPLWVPETPGPEGTVTVHVTVDDTPARALVAPALRVSADDEGTFDPSFPTTLPLVDDDGDHLWQGTAKVRIDPDRRLGGTTSETFPYVIYVASAGVDYPSVGTQVEALTEADVEAQIRVGNPALVPVTFRVDASAAYLNPAGSLRGVFNGEAVYLTGEFGAAEDAFGQNAADAFAGGENVVLEMSPGAGGVWARTLFLGPGRTYGWKAVRCPAGVGCSNLNRHVTSSGRAFATVMKNLATENLDALTSTTVRIVDPRAPGDFAGASVYVGTGTGLEPDPEGTPDGARLFKQELPDLVVEVGADPVVTPVIVVGTWRDVNLPQSLASIVAANGAFDLNPWDYDAGFVGGAAPSYPWEAPLPVVEWELGDGAIDAEAQLVAGGAGTMRLHAALSGTTLYVATDDAGEGSDHFLFVATAAGAPVAAPWAKAGTVALPPSARFLVDENEGTFAGWFQLSDGAQLSGPGAAAAGGVLEGTIDLGPTLPETIVLAAVPFASADGGALYAPAQTPATINSDGNLDATELVTLRLADIEVRP